MRFTTVFANFLTAARRMIIVIGVFLMAVSAGPLGPPLIIPAASAAADDASCDACIKSGCDETNPACTKECLTLCVDKNLLPAARPGEGDEFIPRRPCAVPNPLSFLPTVQDPCSDEAVGQLKQGLGGQSQGFFRLDDVIDVLAFFIAVVAAPVSITMIIWSGIQFLFAQGNPEKIKRAKRTFYWTIIGVAIVIGVFAILATIRTFFRSTSTVL